jgi:hypothetical protein
MTRPSIVAVLASFLSLAAGCGAPAPTNPQPPPSAHETLSPETLAGTIILDANGQRVELPAGARVWLDDSAGDTPSPTTRTRSSRRASATS